jgi:FtsH-binding integral membrane protein
VDLIGSDQVRAKFPKTIMSQYINPYVVGTISESPESERAAFIRKTYWHLAGAIGLFAALEGLLISMGLGTTALALLGASKYSWLMVLGAFMLVSWVAERWATNGSSVGMQYAGLLLYTVAEAVIFLPMIVLAIAMPD